MSVVMNEGSLDEVDWGCAEAQDEHGDSPEAPEGASRNKEASRKCNFSMMPTEMIESPQTRTVRCFTTISTFARAKQGVPFRGAQSVADALGMQARTVMTHARHLADLGWIEIDPTRATPFPRTPSTSSGWCTTRRGSASTLLRRRPHLAVQRAEPRTIRAIHPQEGRSTRPPLTR